MRVIGGELRGRRLSAPVGPDVRPTSDRVRESVFNILFSLGGVDGMQVVDLFAGTGALGIVALSRGASSVTFVEQDVRALESIRANLAAIGLADGESAGDTTVIRADADAWVAQTVSRYDLALCDPPYHYQGWEQLLPRLPADLVVLESGADLDLPEGWETLRTRRYGGTIVTVARPLRAIRKGVL